MNNIIENPADYLKCAYCTNEATALCDYITDYGSIHTFYRHRPEYNRINSNPKQHCITCDLPMCDSCKISKGRAHDLCQFHNAQLQVPYPDKYKKARLRAKKMESRIIFNNL